MSLFDEEPGQTSGPKFYPQHALAPGNEQNLISGIPGHLLLVWATGYIESSPTKFTKPGQKSDVIVVDVVDLDQPDEEGYQGAVFRQSWWRGGRLIQFLRPRLGRPRPVVARMTLGINSMGKPPYELDPMTGDPECVERATAWFAAHPDFRPTPLYGEQSQAAQPVVAREKSQLEQFAEANLVPQRAPHQQALRDALDKDAGVKLPPPRPTGVLADSDIPF